MKDWEIADMTWLGEDLYETKIWFREVDKLVWIPSEKMGFQVKTYYNALWEWQRLPLEKHMESLSG